MTSDELKARVERARYIYNKALDKEIVSKAASLAAWENYERCQHTYEEALTEEKE